MISLQLVNAKAGSFHLTDVTFDVPQGSYGVVIGPAGSGKTTLLETVAGVVKTTSGRIMLGGEDLTAAPPERRRLGIVYQHAFLFPHLSVQQNVEYGALSESIAADVAERFGVMDLYERPVASLSGGERQLVAIARSLARRPEVLLLDEPFSALDALTRIAMHRLVLRLWESHRPAVLLVTHDVDEALILADRVLVLASGRIVFSGPVDLPRPRDRDNPGLTELRHRLLTELGVNTEGQ